MRGIKPLKIVRDNLVFLVSAKNDEVCLLL